MRKLTITLALLGVAALTAAGQQTAPANNRQASTVSQKERRQHSTLEMSSLGPDGKVKCTSSASGKAAPCTANEVASLNTALSGRNQDMKGGIPANSVRSIGLAKDGSLMCVTASGTVPCTSTQLPELKQAADLVKGVFGLDTKPQAKPR